MGAATGRERVWRVSACPAPSPEERGTRPWERAPAIEPADLSSPQSGAEKQKDHPPAPSRLSPGGREQELHILATPCWRAAVPKVWPQPGSISLTRKLVRNADSQALSALGQNIRGWAQQAPCLRGRRLLNQHLSVLPLGPVGPDARSPRLASTSVYM